MPTQSQNAETIVLHAGYRSDPTTTAVAVPIYQTTSYQFNSTEHAANLFALKELGNIYTRIMNPTQAVLEERVAALEGGVAGLGLASGQAASLYAVQNICHAGDNFLCSTDIYGGTWNLFQNTMSTMGIECRFIDPADPENFRRATDARTRCYYGETLPNPKLAVFPIAEVAKIGRELGVPLIMDNTATPVLCQPISTVPPSSCIRRRSILVVTVPRLAASSSTVEISTGRNTPIAFRCLTSPIRATTARCGPEAVKPLGPIAYILKARVTLLRDIGAAMSPFNAFMFIQGLETLALRMREHCSNAASVAQYLSKHPKVTKTIFPGLMTGEPKRRADAYLKGGYGNLVGFELKGGRAAGRKFIDSLKMFYHVANIGDTRSLAIHPATTTHSQLTPEEQAKTGVTDGYVRLSVGIEHIDDIIADLDQALAAA